MLLEARERESGFLGLRNSYWGPSLLTLKGRAFPVVPMVLYLAYSIGVLCIALYPLHGSKGLIQLTNIKDVASMIGFALFLLLSFRNQSAYGRWYEGAEKWVLTVAGIKEMARRVAAVVITDHPTDAKEMLWWLVAALECMKLELRRSDDFSYIYPLLSQEHMEELISAPDRVQYAFYRYVLKSLQSGDIMIKTKSLWGELSGQCYTYYIACTRILNTPFPFSYIAHLRTLLFIWLSLLPWYLAPIYEWYMLILTSVIGYAIIGIEEAASEVEQPFGTDFNDLSLDEMAESGYQALEMYLEIAKDRERELNLVSSQSENHDEVEYAKFRAEMPCGDSDQEEQDIIDKFIVKDSKECPV